MKYIINTVQNSRVMKYFSSIYEKFKIKFKSKITKLREQIYSDFQDELEYHRHYVYNQSRIIYDKLLHWLLTIFFMQMINNIVYILHFVSPLWRVDSVNFKI